MKTCTKCKIEKPFARFPFRKSSRDGYRSQCRACVNAGVTKNRERPEIKAERARYAALPRRREAREKWRKSPAGKVSSKKYEQSEGRKQWYRDRDQTEARRQYRLEYQRSDSCKESLRKYRRSDKGRVATAKSNQVRQARMSVLPSTLTAEQWAAIQDYFGHACAYCGKENCKLTMDHVIPVTHEGGLTQDNIVPACGSCNSSKNNTPLLTFLGMWPVPR